MRKISEPPDPDVGDIPFDPSYFPARVPPKDSTFFAPSNEPLNHPSLEERDHYLATVHGFDKGGFEASVRWVDAQKMIDAAMRPR